RALLARRPGAVAEPPGYARSMKETVERESKLTPGEGFVLPELGGEADAPAGGVFAPRGRAGGPPADPRLRLHLPRHRRLRARAARGHAASPRRGRDGSLAAEASPWRRARRARAARS